MNNETNWKLTSNEKGLYILTLNSQEGVEKLWLSAEELFNLKLLLNSMAIPFESDDLPL